jgi:hypothetical protein
LKGYPLPIIKDFNIMEETFETLVKLGCILDSDIELFICENKIKMSLNSKGYPKIYWHRKSILLSHFIVTPLKKYEVDHINGDPLDNRRINLRLVTHTENMWNSKIFKTNKSGIKGICQDSGSLLWCAYIEANKIRYRKKFKCFNKAVKWRIEMEQSLHGIFARK